MYQVGFGDCFLLSFTYPAPLPDGRTERHVLIDMGSNHPPDGARVDFDAIASDIAARVGSALDVVVLSHRHKDHLAGFGDDSAAALLERVERKLVVRPWTEDPARSDEPAVKALRSVESIAAAFEAGAPPTDTLGALAARQSGNAKAIARLDAWAQAGQAEYLSFGVPSRIGEFVPGVKVHVLGPPLPADAPDVIRERDWYNDQYWLRQFGLSPAGPAGADLALAATPTVAPGPVRWLVDRLGAERSEAAQRLLRQFDNALNNTSVILLLEVGTKRLLFGGDAQWESWQYALNAAPPAVRDEYLPLLGELDLYKVGHHGSLNATPKESLFGLWEPGAAKARGMVGLISTCCGVYPFGRAVAPETPTRVPRLALVQALQGVLGLYATTALAAGDLYLELQAPLDTPAPFAVTAPARLTPGMADLCPPFTG
jgi:hypothetical protein